MRHATLRKIILFGAAIGLQFLSGCGGSGAETLASNEPASFPAFYSIGPFTVSDGATISFNVQDRSTTTPDHWDIGIYTATEWGYYSTGSPATAYAAASGVSNDSDSTSVPAGDYYLGFHCDNLVETCMVSIDLTVTP